VKNGFSLVELLVVLTILTLLSIIAAPNIERILDARSLTMAAEQVRSDCVRLRERAQLSGNPQKVIFSEEEGRYEMYEADMDLDVWVRTQRSEPFQKQVMVKVVTLMGDQLVFNKEGEGCECAQSVSPSDCVTQPMSEDEKITLQVSDKEQDVMVTPLGLITISD